MTNNESTMTVNETGAAVGTRKRPLVATVILAMLSTLLMTLTAVVSASSMKFAFYEAGLEGLALIVLLPAMLLFAVVGIILSVITLVLSLKVRKRYLGGERIFGTVVAVLSSLYIAASVILPILTILLLSNA